MDKSPAAWYYTMDEAVVTTRSLGKLIPRLGHVRQLDVRATAALLLEVCIPLRSSYGGPT